VIGLRTHYHGVLVIHGVPLVALLKQKRAVRFGGNPLRREI
jgi:hypothetical protein